MTMHRSSEEHQDYTRQSVMAYLRAAEAERQRLERAIAEARARTVAARRRAEVVGIGEGCGPPVPVPSLEAVDRASGGLESDRLGEPVLPEWAGHAPADRRRPADGRVTPVSVPMPVAPREPGSGSFAAQVRPPHFHAARPLTPGRVKVIARD
jgi:hypothetical protein